MRFVKHGKTNILLSVDDNICTPKIYKRIRLGKYEFHEMHAATSLSTPDDRILELGAGLGFISTAVCRMQTPAFYAAVEADPRLVQHIERTHHKNGIKNVKLINSAFVSDADALNKGFVELGIGKAFWGTSAYNAGKEGFETIRVDAQDASAFIKENGITFLIADIEGSELSLFKNLDFGGIEKILVEIHPKKIRKWGVWQIFRILQRNKFVYSPPFSMGGVIVFEKL